MIVEKLLGRFCITCLNKFTFILLRSRNNIFILLFDSCMILFCVITFVTSFLKHFPTTLQKRSVSLMR